MVARADRDAPVAGIVKKAKRQAGSLDRIGTHGVDILGRRPLADENDRHPYSLDEIDVVGDAVQDEAIKTRGAGEFIIKGFSRFAPVGAANDDGISLGLEPVLDGLAISTRNGWRCRVP